MAKLFMREQIDENAQLRMHSAGYFYSKKYFFYNICKLYFLLPLVLIPSLLLAQEEVLIPMQDPTVLKEGITKLSKETTSIQADFEQIKHMELLAGDLISKGKILFKAPDLLRWEYNEPFQYLILLNSKKMHIKDEEKTNTFDLESSQTFKEINKIIVNSVQGNILDSERFNIEYFEADQSYMAKLNATQMPMKEIIEAIEIYFDKSDFGVTQIKLLEPSGDFTKLIFKNRQLNQPIDNAAFSIN